jgi:hypothetical protein
MKNEPNKSNNTKKAYQKPQLRQVRLRPEEAVLGSCKMSGTSGPGGSACVMVGGMNCSTPGS